MDHDDSESLRLMVPREVERSSTSDAPVDDVGFVHVTKRYGAVTAVDDVNLTIRKGEFFSLLGPSGCGKTTTLRMVAGFERPTQGHIYLNGVPVEGVPPHRRSVNTVFQNYALFPHLSVKDNVAFGLRRQRTPKAELGQRVKSALEMVEMQGLALRKPSQLSGGQQQRVALARALVNLPTVLLLDEPLGALDAKLRKSMQLELKKLQSEVGITFIYVTHDQEEALTMSDRIAVMSRGVIEQVGTPAEIYEHPNSAFVANFIGVSNVFMAAVRSAAGGELRCETDQGLEIVVPLAGRDFASGQRIGIVLRPEKLTLQQGNEPRGAAGFHNTYPATIQSSVYVGSTTQIVVEIAGRQRAQVLQSNALPGQGVSCVPGQQVVVSFAGESCSIIEDAERAQVDKDLMGEVVKRS
jgi:spermidine/putrescine transport system ATP-binding protein